MEYSQKARMTWSDVYQNKSKLPKVVTDCIEFCMLHKDSQRLEFSLEELVRYFELAIRIIEEEFVAKKL